MTHRLASQFPCSSRVSSEAREMAIVVRTWAQREVLSQRPAYRQHYGVRFREQYRLLSSDLGLRGLLIPEQLGGGG